MTTVNRQIQLTSAVSPWLLPELPTSSLASP